MFPNIAEKYRDIGNYHDEAPYGILFCSTPDENKDFIHTEKKLHLKPKVVLKTNKFSWGLDKFNLDINRKILTARDLKFQSSFPIGAMRKKKSEIIS